MPKKYDFPTAFSTWGEEEREAIVRVVASGQFTQGPEVAAFEEEFAAYHGRKHAVMVNSGSSANLLMVATLACLGHLKPGDIAAVPALAWSTTYAPLVQHGVDLRLLDCDDTWNAKADPVREAGVKLFVACSILGTPAAASLARPHPGFLIEDNCESLGATLGGKHCGSFGLMSSSSLFYSHQISAIEGGVVMTDDESCLRMLKMLRSHGWTRDVRDPADPPDFEHEYDFRLFGYNVRGLELHAAIARAQLRKLDGFIKQRVANLALFWDLAAGLPIEKPRIAGAPSPFGIHFCCPDQDVRTKLAAALRANDIDCRLPTGGSFRLHRYGSKWAGQRTPNADAIHRTGMFLGNGGVDLSEKITKAVAVIRAAL